MGTKKKMILLMVKTRDESSRKFFSLRLIVIFTGFSNFCAQGMP